MQRSFWITLSGGLMLMWDMSFEMSFLGRVEPRCKPCTSVTHSGLRRYTLRNFSWLHCLWPPLTNHCTLHVKKLPQHYQEMNYIKYEVNFLPLFYVENIKFSVYVKSLHHFNFFLRVCNGKTKLNLVQPFRISCGEMNITTSFYSDI